MRIVYANLNNTRIFLFFCYLFLIKRLFCQVLSETQLFSFQKIHFQSGDFVCFLLNVNVEFHILCFGSKKAKRSFDIFPSSSFPFDTNRAVSSLLGIPGGGGGAQFLQFPALFPPPPPPTQKKM